VLQEERGNACPPAGIDRGIPGHTKEPTQTWITASPELTECSFECGCCKIEGQLIV
jgi:hypothetical protein